MKIAVYGNLANNAYVQARLLRRAGVDAELVIDPVERGFVMSDPRWEDLDLELPTDGLSSEALPRTCLPDWVRDEAPDGTPAVVRRAERVAAGLQGYRSLALAHRTAGWEGVKYAAAYAKVIRRLRTYDCAFVFGLGPIVAGLAGVPFVTLPFGGDITIVPFADGDGWQGQQEPGTRPPGGPEPFIAALQRHGLRRSDRLLLCDPGFFSYVDRLGLLDRAIPFHFGIDTEMYSPAPEEEIRRKWLGDDTNRILIFVPARQDWYWKGSDLMLRGFAGAAAGRDDVMLVCAGWGADLERSRELIAELGIESKVRLLDHAVSKQRLLRYYRAADIVMDQFMLGSYGGSSLEAMSCAKPLFIHIDEASFRAHGDGPPPAVNVREPEDIAARLTELFDSSERRAQIGAEARRWVVERHGPRSIERVIELCRAAAQRSGRGD
jgi:glycosyltransferase involved in cell wall biosynthesis